MIIPWCLYLMGNSSCVQFRRPRGVRLGGGGKYVIKVIRSDGLVKIYDRPIKVSELMLEFPKHRVCHSDSLYIGQKIPPLSEDAQLQPGHNYFLLPKHFFQSVLTFVTIASFASSSNYQIQSPNSFSTTSRESSSKNAFLKKATTCQPFHIHKTTSGCVRLRVSEEFLSQLMEHGNVKEEEKAETEEDENKHKAQRRRRIATNGGGATTSNSRGGRVCTTPHLQKEYTQLVRYSQQSSWKPKLETIRESTSKKRRKLRSFGIKRRIRTNSQYQY